MSRKYAKGRNAVAECQRSGQKMLYRDLVEDGHVPGLLVHPDWWEPKHPQEIPVRVDDPIALYRPAPEISIEDGYGDPEAGGNPDFAGGANITCASEPSYTLFVPTTTLAVDLSVGATTIPTEDAIRYSIGQCIYVRRDDDTWFVSKSTSEALTPTYTVPVTTGVTLAGSGFTAGNEVYIGVDGGNGGGGVPVPPPDGFIMVLTESSSSERPKVVISEDDITTWSEANMAGGSTIGDRHGLAYDDSLWVSVGAEAGTTVHQIWTNASDGSGSWTEIAVFNELRFTFYDVGWSATHDFIAVGEGGRIYGSDDAADENWFLHVDIGVTEDLHAVDVSGSNYIAVGDAGVVVRGNGGLNTEVGVPAATNLRAVKRSSSRICCGGANGIVYRSDDEGATWTAMTGTALGGAIRGLAHNGSGTWIAVGESRNILRSTDNGVTFATVSNVVPASNEFRCVIYDSGTTSPYGFIAAGEDGATSNRVMVYTSLTGETWTLRHTGTASSGSGALTVRGKNSI